MLLCFERPNAQEKDYVDQLEKGRAAIKDSLLEIYQKTYKESDLDTWVIALLESQDEKGFWALLDTPNVDGDIRVRYWYEPTYMVVATLIYYKIKYPEKTHSIKDFDEILRKGLNAAIGRGLQGHGYDDLKGMLKALEILAYGHILDFIDLYPTMNEQFTAVVEDCLIHLAIMKQRRKAQDMWGQSYIEEVEKVDDLLTRTYERKNVFV